MSKKIVAQDQFFHEIALRKEFLKAKKYHLFAEASWKHIYADVGWRRWGLSPTFRRTAGKWNFDVGINTNYTFHRRIVNYLELRPWVGARFTFKLFNQLKLNQTAKLEWRNFLYDIDIHNDTYTRLRYNVGLDYAIKRKVESKKPWKILLNMEWYFLKDPVFAERYANSSELSLRAQHRLVNDNNIQFGYKLEKFFNRSNSHGILGNTFMLKYLF